MSSFNGLFGMSGSLGLGAPLDPSHHPFKRSAKRPGGPGHRPDEQMHKWECDWRPPAVVKGKPSYRQLCTNIQTGKKKMVVIPKARKKAYNKKYRAGKYPKAKRFKVDKRHPGWAYTPSKSPSWAAAGKSKSKKRARKS